MPKQDIQVENTIGTSSENPDLEDPMFSDEFLSAFKETAFHALEEYLEKIEAPKAVLDLLENLSIFTTWESSKSDGRKISWSANQFLLESIAQASHNISQIGGVFYSPSGTTYPRENTG